MKLSEYVHHRVQQAGATHAFGVPGYFVMPIWQAFTEDPSIVLARHESGAAFMADGYSRTTGRLGVVLATIGPGMANCVTGVACAYRDSIPLLVVTGQAPTATFGRGAFLESYILDRAVSPAGLFGSITKKSIEVVDIANATFLIDAAITLALSGRPGPVHLSVPIDLQQQELPAQRQFEPAPAGIASWSADAALDVEVLRRCTDTLMAARRPLVVVGWGAVQAQAAGDVSVLARQLGAIVVCTTKAVAALPATDPSRLGHLGPGQRSDIASALKTYDPDVILVLGASLSTFYAQPLADLLERATVIRADIDADQLHMRARVDLALHGDVANVVRALRRALPRAHPANSDATDRLTMVAGFQDRAQRAATAQTPDYQGMPSMAGTIARLGALLPNNAVVLPDAGNHWLDTIALHQPPCAGAIQLNCGIGAMGWAIGAAVGMAIAHPDRQIVCITGDGSMLMHGSELSVAAEHNLNLLALVFNNRSHGRVRLGQRVDFDGDTIGTDLPDVNFSLWMRAMGLRTFKIQRPDDIETVLRAALDTPGPVGVEIDCHPDETPASLRNWIEES